MEKKLARLFDFQKMEPNEKLSNLIADVEGRYGSQELSDEDLDQVSAAINIMKKDSVERGIKL